MSSFAHSLSSNSSPNGVVTSFCKSAFCFLRSQCNCSASACDKRWPPPWHSTGGQGTECTGYTAPLGPLTEESQDLVVLLAQVPLFLPLLFAPGDLEEIGNVSHPSQLSVTQVPLLAWVMAENKGSYALDQPKTAGCRSGRSHAPIWWSQGLSDHPNGWDSCFLHQVLLELLQPPLGPEWRTGLRWGGFLFFVLFFFFSGIWALWDLYTEKQMYSQIPVLPVFVS